MKITFQRIPAATRAVLFLFVMTAANLALAQLNMSWNTINGGGGVSSVGGPGTLNMIGTIGQPDAGPSMLNGGLALAGGFWYGEPSPVLLANIESLTAERSPDGQSVIVRWTTTLEINNLGFNVQRQILGKDGIYGPMELANTALIPGLGDDATGTDYQFVDPLPISVGERARAYYLEDIDTRGVRSSLTGPARVVFPSITTGWAVF